MILRSILMLLSGVVILPLGLAVSIAWPSFNDHYPLTGTLVSILLVSMGPALLITGAVNLVIGVWRSIRSA